MTSLSARLQAAVDALPRAYAGPGGAVAVLREGEVLARHAWGYANAERRIPFTPRTLFRMCSITKQFTCATMLDAFPDPSALDAAVRARLPRLEQPAPTARHLAHNQSGLRDYWAVAMLHGAPAESAFGEVEAARVIGGARTLQFAPGTRYSYANQNFRLLSDALETETGRSFAELLRERVFSRVGMESAFLAADTRAMPDGTEGYEGGVQTGFRPAENRVLWTGDAGLGASLDDMIAWEKWIDACRDEPDSLYGRLAAPVTFADGAPAAYGFGLARGRALGVTTVGHGGALRGWRSHRLYAPDPRVSVVVLFNHLGDTYGAALDLLAAVLDAPRPTPAVPEAPPACLGAYLEPETGLSVRLDRPDTGPVRLRFGHSAERLAWRGDGSLGEEEMRLVPRDDGVWLERPRENQVSRLTPLAPPDAADAAGVYHCAELDARITVEDRGGALYGGFSGFLGLGRMELLEPVGADVWALPCPRALDHTPPGDWTLALRRDPAGAIEGLTAGCWLARGLAYKRDHRSPWL